MTEALRPYAPHMLIPIEVQVPAYDWHPHLDVLERYKAGQAPVSELADSYRELAERYAANAKDRHGNPYHPEFHELVFCPTPKARSVLQ